MVQNQPGAVLINTGAGGATNGAVGELCYGSDVQYKIEHAIICVTAVSKTSRTCACSTLKAMLNVALNVRDSSCSLCVPPSLMAAWCMKSTLGRVILSSRRIWCNGEGEGQR